MADMPAEVNSKVLPRLISTGISLLATFGTLVFFIKYLVPRMDPSRAERERSRQRASEILRRLKIKDNLELDEYELCVAQVSFTMKTFAGSVSF